MNTQNPSAAIQNARVLKVQRPVIYSRQHKRYLLVYSLDCAIPPTLIPDTGEISEALGRRFKAYFLCYVNSNKEIHLGQEVHISQ